MISSTMLSRQMLNIQKITRIHFYLLGILLFNLAFRGITGLGLNYTLIVLMKGILYLTGIFLFFKNLRPFKMIATYFSLYVLTPTIVVIFYFAGGIFLGLLSSVAIAPIMPIQPEYNDGNVKLYHESNGFFGSSVRYYATQNKLYLFEQHKGSLCIEEEVNIENIKITLENDSAVIFSDSVYRVKLNK
jgi:hypothetical protein